LKFEAGQIV